MILNLKLNRGFTLIEVVVAMAGFVILSVGVMALFSGVFISSSKQSALLADSDQARRMSFSLINELRNAQTASTGAYALDTAQAQALTFYSNVDGGTDVEKVRYFVQNGALKKGVIKPSGSPLGYNSVNEKILTVQNNLANGTGTIFSYFDGSFNGAGSGLAQPVSVTEVKLVKLDLKIYNKAGVVNKNFYSVTASAAIRGLKANLAD